MGMGTVFCPMVRCMKRGSVTWTYFPRENTLDCDWSYHKLYLWKYYGLCYLYNLVCITILRECDNFGRMVMRILLNGFETHRWFIIWINWFDEIKISVVQSASRKSPLLVVMTVQTWGKTIILKTSEVAGINNYERTVESSSQHFTHHDST